MEIKGYILSITDSQGETKIYSVNSLPSDRYGILRYSLIQPETNTRYSLSYDPNKYQDSVIPGWGCSCKGWTIKRGLFRKCKHVTAMANLINSSKAA